MYSTARDCPARAATQSSPVSEQTKVPSRLSTNRHLRPQPPILPVFRIKLSASKAARSAKSGKSSQIPISCTCQPTSFIRSRRESGQCGRIFAFSSFFSFLPTYTGTKICTGRSCSSCTQFCPFYLLNCSFSAPDSLEIISEIAFFTGNLTDWHDYKYPWTKKRAQSYLFFVICTHFTRGRGRDEIESRGRVAGL